jgi:CRISPR-associated protein Csm4
MKIHRLRLVPRSAFLSPWQADTIFGHLCWAIRHHEGENALLQFLEPFLENEPPLVLSNAFPSDFLPRPLQPAPGAPELGRTKVEQVAAMRWQKKLKGIGHVRLDEFNILCRGESLEPVLEQDPLWTETILKNQINRLTGGTTALDEEDGGNLYGVDEHRFVDSTTGALLPLTVYVKVADDKWAERTLDLFQRVSLSGFGAKKSAGYGQFEVQDFETFDGFPQLPGANGFVSLSNFVPAPGDPDEGHYHTLVKYGKLGEEYASSGRLSPFKFPILMLGAGSAFYTSEIRDFYGQVVRGVHPEDQRIVQYGYSFALPIRLAQTTG